MDDKETFIFELDRLLETWIKTHVARQENGRLLIGRNKFGKIDSAVDEVFRQFAPPQRPSTPEWESLGPELIRNAIRKKLEALQQQD